MNNVLRIYAVERIPGSISFAVKKLLFVNGKLEFSGFFDTDKVLGKLPQPFSIGGKMEIPESAYEKFIGSGYDWEPFFLAILKSELEKERTKLLEEFNGMVDAMKKSVAEKSEENSAVLANLEKSERDGAILVTKAIIGYDELTYLNDAFVENPDLALMETSLKGKEIRTDGRKLVFGGAFLPETWKSLRKILEADDLHYPEYVSQSISDLDSRHFHDDTVLKLKIKELSERLAES